MPDPETTKKILKSFDQSVEREWLLTNGRGGFSSGTYASVNTRRYHGLLVASARPPLERWLLLSAMLERVTIGEQVVELGNFEFADGFHPFGFVYQRSCTVHPEGRLPWARFIYETDDFRLTKWIILPQGDDNLIVRYHLQSSTDRQMTFCVSPFLAMRDFHGLTQRDDTGFGVDQVEGCVTVDSHFEGPRLWMRAGRPDGGEPVVFDHDKSWWYKFLHRSEAERGLDDREDLFSPGWFRTSGRGNIELQIQAYPDFGGSTHIAPPPAVIPTPTDPKSDGAFKAPRDDADKVIDTRLEHAANAFVVDRQRPNGLYSKTILAGYPWFGDWGRDAFIALPGLLLETKRFAEAREVLETFASAQRDGLIPNRFEDHGRECIYNSVDASLWYIHAADAYLEASDDAPAWDVFVGETCEKVVDAFTRGTIFNIHADDDHLLTCGDATLQLTWMDAKHGKTVFTPRHGKPVEINALWYHALCIMARREADKAKAARYRKQADAVKESFVDAFWNKDRKCLFDVVRLDEKDDAVRPNQIFAVSLPDSPLTQKQQKSVLSVVRRELLTPFGLRSLSPEHEAYSGTYTGDSYQRDSVYHQGTVWGWLIGPYVDAYLRVNGSTDKSRAYMKRHLKKLTKHLDEACVGSISEIFDGDKPHTPRGCPAQAWSVAELFRAWRLVTKES